MTPRLLVLIGSGETGPAMIPVHTRVLERLPDAAAVLLDSSYGFQVNADQLTERICAYWSASLRRPLTVATLRRLATATPTETERFLGQVAGAGIVFAGPGSPTHALAQWAPAGVGPLLAAKLTGGGALIFASAAAVTLGSMALPVYEIYKVGEAPHWRPGLNVLGALGWDVAVVPHYDNAEGGGHDTRRCFIGADRMSMLEEQLPPTTRLLGIDEHTALIIDLDAMTADVAGHGGVTVRRDGEQHRFASGESLPLQLLAADGVPVSPPTAMADDADRRDDPDRARDVPERVAELLALDEAVAGGGADAQEARRRLRRGLVELGDLAGSIDITAALEPLVAALLDLRIRARAEKRWADADAIRDALSLGGVEVRDGDASATWVLREAGPDPVRSSS